MLIFGFDPAIENLGIVVVDFIVDWRDKIKKYIDDLDDLYNKIESLNTLEFLSKSLQIINELDSFVSKIIHIRWFNVIDLIPGRKIKDVDQCERTRLLKTVLCALDKQFDKPSLVLIEYQMGPNDISRNLASQIMYHYVDNATNVFNLKSQKNRLEESNECITYAVKDFPIDTSIDTSICNTTSCEVKFIPAGLKNSYHVTKNGIYSNFISKSSNYVANKAHTSYNFEYFIKCMMNDGDKILNTILNKKADFSDAFMMIYGYLKKNQMI